MGARFTTTSRPGTSQCARPVEGSRALRDTAPSLLRGPLSSPDGLRPRKLEGPRETRTHLLPHSPLYDHHPSDYRQSSATNGCSR